jgi:glycosyltransferase involved in cell wall biosynthesis
LGLSLKIVINAFSARLGGGQTYLRNLLAYMPERDDLEVLVFAPTGLELPNHPQLRRMVTPWPTTNPLLRAIWERLVLPNVLRRERADVLFCPGGVVATTPPPGCKVVTMFRNMIPFDPLTRQNIPWGLQRLRNVILKRVMLKSMANADLTIFISDHARGVIKAMARIKNPVTIPHGISPAFRSFNQALKRPAFLPEGGYLLYVSRFDVYKHHYEVVSAYAKLSDELRRRFALVLVGEADMPEAERVRQLIEQLGLGDRVKVLGAAPYSELPAFYHHAQLVLFASSCENCPNILLEALGSGRPVLSSNVMPMPEFGGEAVAYFSPFDPDDILKTMQKVLTDDDYAQSLAAAAVQRSARYDWGSTAKATWAHMMRLIEVAPAR